VTLFSEKKKVSVVVMSVMQQKGRVCKRRQNRGDAGLAKISQMQAIASVQVVSAGRGMPVVRGALLPAFAACQRFPALHASGAVAASSRLIRHHRNPQLARSHAKL
jgi:coproporphyrinogen III oxidase